MRKRLLILTLALSACQPVAPPPAPAPTPVPAPSPSRSAEPASPVLPGQRLVPGKAVTLVAPAAQSGRLLLANVSDVPAEARLGVEPAGAPLPGPSSRPPDERPPFGFGFGTIGMAPGGESTERPSPRSLFATGGPTIGARLAFWINDGSATLKGDRERQAVLRLITPSAYFLVDEQDGEAVSEPELKRLADAFAQRIRPPLTQTFGTEPQPGIDGESRIFIVLSSWVGAASSNSGMMGYFWPRDPVPRGGGESDPRQHSNEKEVIFLSPKVLTQPEVTGFGTLAHEYQHLLMFSAKSRIDGQPRTEETWLDEGFSMLAMELAGYGLAGGDRYAAQEITDFQQNPGAYSLTDWKGNPDGHSYGLSYLFCRYLVDRFGLSIVKQVQATPKTGVQALDEALRARGTTFANAFVEWALANRPEDKTSSSIRAYAWFDPFGTYGGLALSGTRAEPITEPQRLGVRPWGVRYLQVDGLADLPRTLTIESVGAALQLVEAERKETP